MNQRRNHTRPRAMWLLAGVWALSVALPAARGAFVKPWDALETYYNTAMGQDLETWIRPSNQDPTLTVYTANAGTYELGFDLQNKKNRASGMKSLKFSYQGSNVGHMVAQGPAGDPGNTKRSSLPPCY